MPATPPPGSGPRLREAMPRPLLLVFVALALTAIVAAVALLVRPPSRLDVGLFERRPPPAGALSHDVGEIRPVLPPRVQAPFEAPCPEAEGMKVVAGGAGVARIRAIVAQACRLSAGAEEATASAVRALSGVTVRFAAFDLTGVESAYDTSEKIVYLNVRFASTEIEVSHVAPVLLHEAVHVAGPPDAVAELRARRVELDACRNLVRRDQWPRWCTEAERISAAEQAVLRLREAGYR